MFGRNRLIPSDAPSILNPASLDRPPVGILGIPSGSAAALSGDVSALGLLPLPGQMPAPAAPGPAPAAAQARPQGRLGDLSMKYETSFRPGDEAKAAAIVSPGKGDKGGVSYGLYQLASKTGTLQNFMDHEGAQWAPHFAGLDPTERGGAYGKTWQAIARENPRAFADAQQAFIQRTHYEPLVASVLKRTGVDIGKQPKAVQEAVWSMAVQHSGAPDVVTRAVLATKAPAGSPGYADALIDNLYDARARYVTGLKDEENLPKWLNRYRLERADAHAMLTR
jgi:type VI secretion system secreted protein VgrG